LFLISPSPTVEYNTSTEVKGHCTGNPEGQN